ncbi:hypothetical protein ACA910_022515 [Epithemia clementina (nom. ined.)]
MQMLISSLPQLIAFCFTTTRTQLQEQQQNFPSRNHRYPIYSTASSSPFDTSPFSADRSRKEDEQGNHGSQSPRTSSSLHLLSPLGLDFDQLSMTIGGKGRAKMIWECFRRGVDPMDEYEGADPTKNSCSDFGQKAKRRYMAYFGRNARIQDSVSKITSVQVSRDGTVKLLLHLLQDGLEVETVIIPWEDRKNSTLCVSSQVGCRQGCTFCMTGRMGKLRSLSADEILSQVFHAMTLTLSPYGSTPKSLQQQQQDSPSLYPVDNIVFMGMGEPGDNAVAVVTAAKILVDSNQFQFAPRRVTISTVAPSPETFAVLGMAPVVLAWSVHSSSDKLRKQLVPTTQHSMVELREGLIQVLQQRPRKLQSIMLEITLLDGINDSVQDALDLADFCWPIVHRVPNGKLVVNLIPWNDIAASSGPAKLYRPPSRERVVLFQNALVERGLRCYIRTTRGDDESAACGQLATAKVHHQP